MNEGNKAKITNINHILEHTAKTLKAIRLNGYSQLSGETLTACLPNEVIKLPNNNNIEWIYMRKLGLTLDMTECNKLIGAVFYYCDPRRFLWPKDESRAIPLVVGGESKPRRWMTDILQAEYWQRKAVSKEINAKFVLLKRSKNLMIVAAQSLDSVICHL